jgi:GxxExxY protein
MTDYKHSEITDAVICAFYNIYNTLGYGFLEKAYENALVIELRKLGLKAEKQVPITVTYSGEVIGEYFCDLLVEDRVIVEIKASRTILPGHEAQLLNYLKATQVEVGLLLNFGSEPQVMRKAFSNNRKHNINNGTQMNAERA